MSLRGLVAAWTVQLGAGSAIALGGALTDAAGPVTRVGMLLVTLAVGAGLVFGIGVFALLCLEAVERRMGKR